MAQAFDGLSFRWSLIMSASLIGRLGSSAFRLSTVQCRCRSRARASLRNRHLGPSIMGFEDEVEQSLGRPCREERQVQADMRTYLIRRPARDIIPPLGEARVSSYRVRSAWAFMLLQLVAGPIGPPRGLAPSSSREAEAVPFHL